MKKVFIGVGHGGSDPGASANGFREKDLNLSDTARQLYIHRNTLVYRLDKVQRQTGLDLRSFDDAVTFKILMELKKTGGDRSAHK